MYTMVVTKGNGSVAQFLYPSFHDARASCIEQADYQPRRCPKLRACAKSSMILRGAASAITVLRERDRNLQGMLPALCSLALICIQRLFNLAGL